jgi:ABC-type transport system involved in multi-copper enzyme maturation permease subunit
MTKENSRGSNGLVNIAIIITLGTVKRLLLSKKTYGIICLCLIPIIVFSLWRADAFPDEDETKYDTEWANIPELDEIPTDTGMEVIIDPSLVNIYLATGNENGISLTIQFAGNTTGVVDHLALKLYLYFEEGTPPTDIFAEIPWLVNGSLRGPIDFGVIVFQGLGDGGDSDWSSWKFLLNLDPSLFPGQNGNQTDPDGSGNGDGNGQEPPADLDQFIPKRIGIYVQAFSDNISTEQDWTFTYREIWLEFFDEGFDDIGVINYGVVGVELTEEEETGYEVFFNVATPLYFLFIVPLITMLYSISVVREDIENHTIVYFLTRPVSKTEVLLYKYLGTFISTWLILAVSICISFFISASSEGSIFSRMDYLGTVLLLLTLNVLTYSILFILFALLITYPIILSLLYVFVWETIISQQANIMNRFSILFHIQSIADGMLGSIAEVTLYDPASANDSILVLIGLTIGLFLLAAYMFRTRDFA